MVISLTVCECTEQRKIDLHLFQVQPRSLNYGYNCFIFTAAWAEDTPSTKTTHCVYIEPSQLTLSIFKKDPDRQLSPNTVEPKQWSTQFNMTFNVLDPDLPPQPGVNHDVNSDIRVSSFFIPLLSDDVDTTLKEELEENQTDFHGMRPGSNSLTNEFNSLN